MHHNVVLSVVPTTRLVNVSGFSAVKGCLAHLLLEKTLFASEKVGDSLCEYPCRKYLNFLFHEIAVCVSKRRLQSVIFEVCL